MTLPDATPRTTGSGRSGAKHAFTLVELLTVMAIIGVLLSGLSLAFNQVKGSSELTSSAEGLVSGLRVARQLAIASNRTVEVRFYQESFQGVNWYRTIRFFEPQSGAQFDMEVGREIHLSQWVAFLRDDTHCSLLLNMLPPQDSPPDTRLGNYTLFAFRPDGTMDGLLDPPTAGASPQLTLTLVSANKIGDGSTLPSNYCTLLMLPTSGRVSAVRP